MKALDGSILNQPECAAGAQIHVGDLDASKQAIDQQPFFVPVKLKGLSAIFPSLVGQH